jgi:hypothetical protein
VPRSSESFRTYSQILETISRRAGGIIGCEAYRAELKALISESNGRLFELVEQSSAAFERGDATFLDPGPVTEYCQRMQARLAVIRETFITANLDAMVECITTGLSDHPVMMPQVH